MENAREILTLLVTSGGLGFLNLYIVQESTSLLNFGTYNKEERVAWLAIYSSINYAIVLIVSNMKDLFHDISHAVGILLLGFVASLLLSFLFPYLVGKIISCIRHCNKKQPITNVPPLDYFMNDSDDSTIIAFDFNGKMINQGELRSGTENRQGSLSLMFFPKKYRPEKTYEQTLESLFKKVEEGKITIREYIDYDRKLHLLKIRKLENGNKEYYSNK